MTLDNVAESDGDVLIAATGSAWGYLLEENASA